MLKPAMWITALTLSVSLEKWAKKVRKKREAEQKRVIREKGEFMDRMLNPKK